MDNKIHFLKVTFQHDDNSQHEMYVDLTDPNSIDQMANYMKDYHTIAINQCYEAINVQIDPEDQFEKEMWIRFGNEDY